jgi:crotonobetainyl-CoA:carnitine CoA-transferase CaiB-like acyl-CoA transferase
MSDVLAGIKVIEVASWTFVPSACAILAEWGADVIKVEDPVKGDPQRALISSMLMPVDGVNFLTELPNRGKRSVGIDIKTREGREILYRLVDDADVFVTNHLPDVRQRLGIDVEKIRARNPGIVYVRGSALGPRGKEAGRGGFDVATYWARGGLASALTPPDADRPIAPRNGFGDYMAGMAMAGGIAAALVKLGRTGEGSVVDVALLNVAMWQLGPDITSAKLYEGVDVPKLDRDALPNPLTGTYRTSDERHITLMMIQSDPFWEDFCEHIDRPDLAGDPRFCDSKVRCENSRYLTTLLREVFAQRTFREWREVLDTLKGVWAPVMTPLEVHSDPQVKANGFLERLVTNSGAKLDIPANPVQFDETPPSVSGAPELGAQTEEVLLELGLTFDEILELKGKGAVL